MSLTLDLWTHQGNGEGFATLRFNVQVTEEIGEFDNPKGWDLVERRLLEQLRPMVMQELAHLLEAEGPAVKRIYEHGRGM